LLLEEVKDGGQREVEEEREAEPYAKIRDLLGLFDVDCVEVGLGDVLVAIDFHMGLSLVDDFALDERYWKFVFDFNDSCWLSQWLRNDRL
jgi:hypothetical protein